MHEVPPPPIMIFRLYYFNDLFANSENQFAINFQNIDIFFELIEQNRGGGGVTSHTCKCLYYLNYFHNT